MSADALHSMRSIGTLTFVAKPILPQRFHAKHSRRLRYTCCLISSQYKAVKLTKWDPQGFNGLEVRYHLLFHISHAQVHALSASDLGRLPCRFKMSRSRK